MKISDFKNNNVDFGVYVELQTLNPEEINIQDILIIDNSQISTFGGTLFDKDMPEKLKIMLSKMSWGIRTYINFQDIFDNKGSPDLNDNKNKPREFIEQCDFNKNYCYFESIAYFKEAVICLLNGNLLASIVLLRPFLELSIANMYWTLMSDKASSYKFYKWLQGEQSYKKGFLKMVDYCYENCAVINLIKESWAITNKKNVKNIYGQLCSYNHTPFLNESIVSYAGNTGKKSYAFLIKLIGLINDTLFFLNTTYLINYPMTLFPQDIYRHFGYFNGPVGLFFDDFNYAIMERYFDKEKLKIITEALNDYCIKNDLIHFINGFNANEEELEDSWRRFVENILKNNKYNLVKDHAARVTLFKSYFRCLRISLSYSKKDDFKYQ